MTARDSSSNAATHSLDDVDLVPAAITRAAEAEMRRCLPVYDDRPIKKHKTGERDYVHLPRYDYSSAQDLETGVVGFIASCGFRREKSATREAIRLLTRYLVHRDAATQTPTDSRDSAAENDDTNDTPTSNLFSIVKMSARGAVLLRLLPRAGDRGGDGSSSPPKSTFARDALLAVRAVESLLQDLSSGTLTPPKHVYRIIPLASTCRHDKESLENCARQSSSVASTLIQQHKDIPLTFGVAVHSRDQQSDKDPTFLSGRRGDVITAVATGLTQGLVECHGIKELKVDLKDPSIVVSVEMLPIMGHLYAGLSLLPRSVCSTKPKLAVKSLR